MSIWKGLGINATHRFFTEPNLTTHLQILLDAGFKKLRINLPSYQTEASNTSFRDQLRNVVETALDLGFDHVICGYTVNGSTPSTLTNTSMTGSYRDALLGMATWAQALDLGHKVEIQLGNEDDGRVDGTTVTTAQYQAYIRGTLADDVRAVFTKGTLSYSTHTGYYNNWKADGIGFLDYFGLNIYGSSVWNAYIPAIKKDFGPRGYISEWNANDNGRDDYASDEAFDKALFERYKQLRDLNIDYYLFGYDFGTSANKWAMYTTNNEYRSAWTMLTNNRKFYEVF